MKAVIRVVNDSADSANVPRNLNIELEDQEGTGGTRYVNLRVSDSGRVLKVRADELDRAVRALK
jgi:hypothetical protein